MVHAWPGAMNGGVILANSVVFTNRRQHRPRHGSLEVQPQAEKGQQR